MSLYVVQRMVKLQDIDAAGIVFFPKFLEYCHDAYFEFLMKSGIDLPVAVISGEYILPLVHAEADFKAPLRFGDEMEIVVANVERGKSSYRVNYEIFKNDGERPLCCTAQTVHAAISRASFKPLKEIPKEIVIALQMTDPA